MDIDKKREDFTPTIWIPRAGVDLKQVWFAGVYADIGGSYTPDKRGLHAFDTPLAWMLEEADAAGLITEPHIRDNLTDGTHGQIHQSRKLVYRVKNPLERRLMNEGKPCLIHPSVKARYERVSRYRPKQLQALVEQHERGGLAVGV